MVTQKPDYIFQPPLRMGVVTGFRSGQWDGSGVVAISGNLPSKQLVVPFVLLSFLLVPSSVLGWDGV